MSIERRSEVIGALGVVEAARGNLLILFSSTAAVNVRLVRDGHTEGFDNITGGVRIARIKPFDSVRIVGAPGTTVVYIVGQENVNEDRVEVFLQVTTVAGTVAVAAAPTTTLTTPVDVSVATATSSDIAANPLRRKITISALSTNAPATLNLRVRDQAATTEAGFELQPGMSVTLETIAALRIRNNDANAQSYTIVEET